jgi:hypothetical protein
MYDLSVGLCSPHMGAMQAFRPPVPRPIVIIAAMRPPMDAPALMAMGVEVITKMIIPTK